MKHLTPQEIAEAITAWYKDRPGELRAAIAAAIQAERDQHRWAAGQNEDEADNAAPWITPCVIDGEPGFHVLFGDLVVDWTAYEDSAYHIIGDLLRRFGTAEQVRLAVLSDDDGLADTSDAEREAAAQTSKLAARIRKVLAA